MGCGCKNKNKRTKVQQQIQRAKATTANQSTPGGVPVKDYLNQLKINQRNKK